MTGTSRRRARVALSRPRNPVSVHVPVHRHSIPVGGRWGAVHPFFPDVPRLLLYDLEADPFAVRAVNDEHPELVKRYTAFLLEQWEAHRLLAQRFVGGEEIPMTPEQLEQLRALGYIR